MLGNYGTLIGNRTPQKIALCKSSCAIGMLFDVMSGSALYSCMAVWLLWSASMPPAVWHILKLLWAVLLLFWLPPNMVSTNSNKLCLRGDISFRITSLNAYIYCNICLFIVVTVTSWHYSRASVNGSMGVIIYARKFGQNAQNYMARSMCTPSMKWLAYTYTDNN